MMHEPNLTNVKKGSYTPTEARDNGGVEVLKFGARDSNAGMSSNAAGAVPYYEAEENCCSRFWTKKNVIILFVVAIILASVLVVILPLALVLPQQMQSTTSQHDEGQQQLALGPNDGFLNLRGNLTAFIVGRKNSSNSAATFMEMVQKLHNAGVTTSTGANRTTTAPGTTLATLRPKRQLADSTTTVAVDMNQVIARLNDTGLLGTAVNLGWIVLPTTTARPGGMQAVGDAKLQSSTVFASSTTPVTEPQTSTTLRSTTAATASTATTTALPTSIRTVAPSTSTTTATTTTTPATTTTTTAATTPSTTPSIIASSTTAATSTTVASTPAATSTVQTTTVPPTTTTTPRTTTTLPITSTTTSRSSSTASSSTTKVPPSSTTSGTKSAGGVTSSTSAVPSSTTTISSTTTDADSRLSNLNLFEEVAQNETDDMFASLSSAEYKRLDSDVYDAETYALMLQLSQMLINAGSRSELCSLTTCIAVSPDSLDLYNDSRIVMPFVIDLDPGLRDVTFYEATTRSIRANLEDSIRREFRSTYAGFDLANLTISLDFPQLCSRHSQVDCWSNEEAKINATRANMTAAEELLELQRNNGTMNSTMTNMTTTIEPEILSTPVLLPPVANCSGHGFQCVNMKQMVGTRQRCDGLKQCDDGSDEEHCEGCLTSLACQVNNNTFICLRGHQLCDNKRDCPNAFDESEQFCRKQCVTGQQYQCKGLTGPTGICIPLPFLCDGDRHCPDGDDEASCPSRSSCNNNAYFCEADKKCIPQWARCDGRVDCLDGADEQDCSCVECSGDRSTLCHAGRGRCIASSMVCNGQVDCPDGEDEENCPGWCKPNPSISLVNCTDGQLYPTRYACSGVIDACKSSCEVCDAEHGFTCAGDKTCVGRKQVCDGTPNCVDGSDEKNCACNATGDYRCQSSTRCIPASKRCDGFDDCPNGDDEANCQSCVNNALGFYCKPKQRCLTSLRRCDGVVDCPDYSDEDECDCTTCKSHYGYRTFMCKANRRCLHQNYLCNPGSPIHCPTKRNQVPEDELVCPKMRDPLISLRQYLP